jgi:hypothetical protein
MLVGLFGVVVVVILVSSLLHVGDEVVEVVVVVCSVLFAVSKAGESVVVVVLLCVMFGVAFSVCLRFFVLKMLSLCW